MKNLDGELEEILARANAAHAANAPAAPPSSPPDDERRTRRLRALEASGWEARPLRAAQSPAYDETRVRAYLDALIAADGSDGGIVVLAGHVGTGKTAACARWALARPIPCGQRFATPLFLRAAEFFRSSRYTRTEGDDRPMSRDEILARRALVLDDVGAEYADGSGNYRVDMDELVDKFHADCRVLVLTTNIAYASPKARAALKAQGNEVDEAAQTFAERYGERIVDRIRESGRWVSSASASMRARGR